MKIFQRFYRSKSIKKQQVGISENDEYRCIVFNVDLCPKVIWQPKTAILDLSQAVGSSEKFTIIRPVSHHYIWRKTIFLPIQYTPEMLYKQIILTLKSELPLDLKQVYFDYFIEKQIEKRINRISLFALRKEYSEKLVTAYPTILDCELHCYLRGFHQLNNQIPEEIKNGSYCIQDIYFKLTNQGVEIITESTLDSQYSIEQLKFPEDVVDKKLYLLALGASLWNGME